MRKKLGGFMKRHDAAVRTLCRLGFAGSIAAVCVLSLLPADTLPRVALSDKLAHMVAYASITTLGLLGYRSARAAAVVMLGAVMLGGALEIGQTFVRGRSGDLLDFAVNSLGVAIGFALARLLLQLWPRRRAPAPGQTG